MFTDYAAFMDIGDALWRGQYTGLYPLPAVGLFALWSLIPRGLGLVLWSALSALALVAVLKRKALMWIFFMPILQVFALGQMDIWYLWLASLKRPIAWALMTLKPQLFLFALPALIADRAAWRPFMLWCAALYLPVTIIRPTWIVVWLHAMDDGRVIEHSSMTLLYAPVTAIFAMLMILALTKSLDYGRVIASFNPFLRQYDLTMLAGCVTAWAIPLSWLTYLMSNKLLLPWPVALLGLLPGKKET